MSQEFAVLHALHVKGLARPEVLSALSGIAPAELESVCRPLLDAGLVSSRPGSVGGYLLTSAGKAEAGRLLGEDDDTAAAHDVLVAFDEDFVKVNSDFKRICHRWQLRPGDQPNDHTDAEYDAVVVAQLHELHAAFSPRLGGLAAVLPRFGGYGPRLSKALGRIRDGDAASFARPMYDSYHDIWMELHNDVVLSIGRGRGAADER